MTDEQSWKRGKSKHAERKFVAPRVADEDFDDVDFYDDLDRVDFEDRMKRYENERKSKKAGRFVAQIIGLFALISIVSLSLYTILQIVGVESISYFETIALISCATVIRIIDFGVSEQLRNRP